MSSPHQSLQEILAQKHLPSLDGLRAISVMLVIGLHIPFVFDLRDRPLYRDLLHVPGDVGVSLFFVLSGFLITRLLLAEWQETGAISLQRFYLRRTLRIFPACYCLIVIAVILDRKHEFWTGLAIVAGFCYVLNYWQLRRLPMHPRGPGFGGQLWSLAVEEQFYLLWPCALRLILRRWPEARGRALVGCIGMIAVWRSLLVFTHHVSVEYAFTATDCRLDTLSAGSLLAIWSSEPWFQPIARATVRWTGLPFVTLGTLAVMRYAIPDVWRSGPGLTVEALLLAIFLLQVMQLHRARTWAWLDHPVTRFIGVVSYPIYLYQFVGLYAGKYGGKLGAFKHTEVSMLLGLGATILLASASYYMVERPLLGLRQRVERRLLGATLVQRLPRRTY